MTTKEQRDGIRKRVASHPFDNGCDAQFVYDGAAALLGDVDDLIKKHDALKQRVDDLTVAMTATMTCLIEYRHQDARAVLTKALLMEGAR